jgi:hypothetical protein
MQTYRLSMLDLHKPLRDSPADLEAASERIRFPRAPNPMRSNSRNGCEGLAKAERGEKKRYHGDLQIRVWLFAKV